MCGIDIDLNSVLITARVRTTGGYVFTGVCLFNFFFGGGYPITGLDRGLPNPRSGQGRYPIPGLDGGGGVLNPRSGWWGGTWVPSTMMMGYLPIWPGCTPPSQVWMVGGSRVPPPPLLDGVPPSGQVWMVGGPRVPPPTMTGWGTSSPAKSGWWGVPPPPTMTGWGTPHPPPPPPFEHLLHSGRCASCVHTGGLSCCKYLLFFPYISRLKFVERKRALS